MVITILKAEVSEDNWTKLRQAYKEMGSPKPPQMVESFLVQNRQDPNVWMILSVWKSMEALQEMRSSGQTPAGILIFRQAGAEPKLTITEVKEGL